VRATLGICESTAAFVLCNTAFAARTIGQANGGEAVFGHFDADIHFQLDDAGLKSRKRQH
jgi:hypothetical protein